MGPFMWGRQAVNDVEFFKEHGLVAADFDSLELVQCIDDKADLNHIGITSFAHQVKLMHHVKLLKLRTLGDV